MTSSGEAPPVCDGEDGLVLKRLPDGLLQQLVRLRIHAGRGFVDAQDLRAGGEEGVKGRLCLRGSIQTGKWRPAECEVGRNDKF